MRTSTSYVAYRSEYRVPAASPPGLISSNRTTTITSENRWVPNNVTHAVVARSRPATVLHDRHAGFPRLHVRLAEWTMGEARLSWSSNVFRDAGHGGRCTAFALDRVYDATGLWMRVSAGAAEWAHQAQAAWWPVGPAPRTTAVAVMQPGFDYWVFEHGGQYRARVSPYGHVGWVSALSRGWVHIHDQGWRSDGILGDRWIWVGGAPVQFIYA